MTIELGTIIKALIPCQVCGQEFWFEFKNKIQECPWCGQRNYRKAIPRTILKKEAGRIGGQTTFSRYGSEGMSDRGKLGGRPHFKIRQQSASSTPLPLCKAKEERLPNELREMKALYLRRNQREGLKPLPERRNNWSDDWS
jgi:hypothetical protein